MLSIHGRSPPIGLHLTLLGPGYSKLIHYPVTGTLDSTAPLGSMTPYLHPIMGKQYNKEIKKKRRLAYLKRRKAATKKAAKK